MKTNLMILKGGVSLEREISLKSFENVIKNIDTQKYNILDIDVKDINILIKAIKHFKPHIILNLMHGGIGEDGTIQSVLSMLNVKYVGSKALSSGICMDKNLSKTILKANNIPVLDYVYIKKSVNLKKFGIILTTIIILIGSVLVGGKNSFKRRENIKEVGSEMIDPLTNEETHLTGDLTNFVVQIKNDNLDISLSDEQINALLKTYDKANEIELPNSNRRLQQLIYQHYLYHEEFSVETFLFGTGYLNNYPELTLEMELPAFLYNFGVIGLILYLGPFIFIIIKGIITFIKKRGIVSINYLMYFICIILSLFLSCLTGYVYFYVSSMLVVLMLYILFISEEENL